MPRTLSSSRRLLWSLLSLILSLALGWGLVTASRSAYAQTSLSGRVVRFHIIASSDSPEDQARKLAVRDALLPQVQALLAPAESAAEAQALLSGALEDLAQAGGEAYEEAGGQGTVTVTLGLTDYPLRETGNLALPGGQYPSLRVILGEGAGHNWWCILFPDLSGAETSPEAAAEAAMAEGLTPDDLSLMEDAEEEYELRLYCLDWLEKVKGWLFPSGEGQQTDNRIH